MRSDVRQLLERQAAWQRSRASMPWAEKLRLSVAMRSALRTMRKFTPATEAVTEPFRIKK